MSYVDDVRRKIYGSIMTAETIGEELKRWRNFFRIKQSQLANEMNISPSVISDYEGSRQRYPGTRFLRKYVESLIQIDDKRREKLIRLFPQGSISKRDTILNIYEFKKPIRALQIIEVTKSDILVNEDMVDIPIYGYTVVNSVAAILNLSGEDFYTVYGASSERAIIFTRVSMGRSPLVAIRVYPLKPRVVILHKPSDVDKLAQKIAEKEKIILAQSKIASENELIKCLCALK